jgi:hypothetical protein
MCNFLSVIVLRDGSVRHHPMLDSHAELVRYFKLPDDRAYHQHFAKAELTPVDWLDASTWTWRIDEETRPDWLEDVEGAAERKTRDIASRMILKRQDQVPPMILDGSWIVGGDVSVFDVRGGWIRRVQDSPTISYVWGGTISVVRGGTISHVWGGTISYVWGGTISDVRGGTISDVWDSAILDDSARVHVLR